MSDRTLEERQAEMRDRLKSRRRQRRSDNAPVDEKPGDQTPAEFEPKISEENGRFCIGRTDLYNLVWSEPIIKAAKRFGISDVALAKACRKEKIPLPGLGYWARVGAGQVISKPELPPGDEEKEARISFSGGQSLATQILRSKIAEIDQEKMQDRQITVPDVPVSLHPLVRDSLTSLSQAKPDATGLLGPSEKTLDLYVSPQSLTRAVCIADTLIKALESRGFPTSLSGTASVKPLYNWWNSDWTPWTRTRVRVMNEELGFEIRESLDRIPHVPSAREKQRIVRGDAYGIPEYDEAPNGSLTLRISVPSSLGLRSAWNDGTRHRIEECLNKCIVGLITAAQAIKTKREERERERREQQERDRLRAEKERRRQEEEERIKRLDLQIVNWKRAQEVRSYALAVENYARTLSGDQPRLIQWVTWIRRYADQLDPLTPSDEKDD